MTLEEIEQTLYIAGTVIFVITTWVTVKMKSEINEKNFNELSESLKKDKENFTKKYDSIINELKQEITEKNNEFSHNITIISEKIAENTANISANESALNKLITTVEKGFVRLDAKKEKLHKLEERLLSVPSVDDVYNKYPTREHVDKDIKILTKEQEALKEEMKEMEKKIYAQMEKQNDKLDRILEAIVLSNKNHMHANIDKGGL